LREKILFISTLAGGWFGGSEELWTRTADLLAKQGVAVAASFQGWTTPLDRRISDLSRVGVDLRPRPAKPSLLGLARRYMTGKAQVTVDIEQSLGNFTPSLVVISDGGAFPPIDLVEMCVARGWPFAIVGHGNFGYWPPDELAARYRRAFSLARQCFFVSEANRALAEKQLGHEYDNAEIVRNPLTIAIESPIPWPPVTSAQELNMACVGRLSPGTKGQDILLQVLAAPNWAGRSWRLTFCGNGSNRDLLVRLVKRLKLDDRVSFAGHVAVEKIWCDHHLLVMPSRHEGMPLAIVEAMFSGRPVVATNVGGIAELVKDGLTGFLAEAAVEECLSRALERVWVQRERLQEMGNLAATSIREFIPDDPIGIFAKKLRGLASLQK
jgi:glycosyltransferase involved in cell wall biosynthesis